MKKLLITLLAIGLFVLAGCSQSDLEKADSFADIAGTWQRVGGTSTVYFRLKADGTYVCADSLELVEQNSGFKGTFWFEGGNYFDQTQYGTCQDTGVYEVHLLPDGNLKWVLVEDECTDRIADLMGIGQNEGLIEWEPVP